MGGRNNERAEQIIEHIRRMVEEIREQEQSDEDVAALYADLEALLKEYKDIRAGKS